MTLSRRDIVRLAAGSGAAAALAQLGRSASMAQTRAPYRAMVGVFLFGGADGWNMIVPTDDRYAGYAAGRGPQLALAREALKPLAGTPFGLHPSLAPLRPLWDKGSLNVVLNTGVLFQPLDRRLYLSRPDLRPLHLMSHSGQQHVWQGLQARAMNVDGFMGRINDRMDGAPAISPLISVAGSSLALLGQRSSPLVLPPTGSIARHGYDASSRDAVVVARQAGLTAFADADSQGPVTRLTGLGFSRAYDQAFAANAILTRTATVDAYFKDAKGVMLNTDIAAQLLRIARLIEARSALGHARQIFFAGHGSYDTHAGQVDETDNTAGRQANLYAALAAALAAFQKAMEALGVAADVTTFTLSDFGRVYRGNAQAGSDHAWGSNHLVIGGGLAGARIHGRYPDTTFRGPEDSSDDGRWIPSIALEEYLGGVVQRFGVPAADMPYVFPNWASWNGGGRGPVPLFG